MGKHKNNYKSKNGRYYVLKGSNAVMIAYNWDQANECFRKYICSPKRQISHCSLLRRTARCAEPPQRDCTRSSYSTRTAAWPYYHGPVAHAAVLRQYGGLILWQHK